jgi:DNA-binding NarL/FixJ family response regulator
MESELQIGATFAGHRIDAVAGRGGMGVVYRATDLVLERPVALKLIAPALAQDEGFRRRFSNECRIAAGLDHPHVVPVFHAGEEEGRLYVTMRLIEGTDLASVLARDERIDTHRATRLVTQVAGALDAAHEHGLVHRDVKPANVLLVGKGDDEEAYLTDFGLTRRRGSGDGATAVGFVMGSANYIAPEQARGEAIDGRADVYSLACVLFHAVTGSAPYRRPSEVETVAAHLNEPIPSARAWCRDVPAALDDVLHRGLAKDPDERPATAGELAADAAGALRGEQVAGVDRMRVVVAEDSVLLRNGVVRLLEMEGFDVVAEAGDAEELLEAVRLQRPDIAVTDIRMPPTHSDEGVRAAKQIRDESPETAVLVLSQFVEEGYAVELLAAGAEGRGYLLKDRVCDPTAFADAVRQVARGGSALDPDVVTRMVARSRRHSRLEPLTTREREILELMAEGRANAEIASGLGIAHATVEDEVERIFDRLELPAGSGGHRRVLAVLSYLHETGGT